ncbi:TetR/AcrR family transcriptional regulator [Micromonospora sp. NPDC018662]|uniref:TetR/AcrR family transcriptional regulator n=1 Tax=Micromonospora sp. NPDC018662 TaxID=3364238 RepID=UPI00379638DD
MTDPPARRRRAPGLSPADRRAMIIHAALPLLAVDGASVTTAQVARAAGIGEATVFRAFPDKAALLHACVAEALRPDAALAELATISLDQPLADRLTAAAETLLAHLDRLAAVLAAVHGAGRPARRGRGETPPHVSREDAGAATREAVAALFAPERDRLRLPPERVAALFLAVLLPGRPPHADDRPAPADLVDLFLHGALAPGSGTEDR